MYSICLRSPLERLTMWCCLLSKVRKEYKRKEIPDSIVWATLREIGNRANRYWEKHGKAGLSREDVLWLRHIYNCRIFQLGELQFQLFHMVYLDREGCGEDYMRFLPGTKEKLLPGSPVINVHIPEGAGLSDASVERCFAMAGDFFRSYFPKHCAKAYLCYSWLLYPDMMPLLPEDSNIRSFAERFTIIGTARDPYGSDAVKRIYGRRHSRKTSYPQDTRLQRNALGNFSRLGFACGIIEIT